MPYPKGARKHRRWTAASAWLHLPPERQRAIVDLLDFDADNVLRDDPRNVANAALAHDLRSAARALEATARAEEGAEMTKVMARAIRPTALRPIDQYGVSIWEFDSGYWYAFGHPTALPDCEPRGPFPDYEAALAAARKEQRYTPSNGR